MTRRSRTTWLLLPIVAALLVAAGTVGLSVAGESDSRACIEQLVANASAEGYRLRMQDSDVLPKGGELGYTTVLTGGGDYIVFACGDAATKDLDIYVYDETGKLVDRDRMSDAQPIVAISPDHTASYHILVKLYAAEGDAFFTLAVMFK